MIACIPDGIAFADLRLSRDPLTREVSFDWEPVERICSASGIDSEVLRRSSEDAVGGLIVAWYNAHRRAGGAADPVAEQLIAEALAEGEYGEDRVQPGSEDPQ